jgi:nucleoside-diphosphate-sugar epimerase
MCPPATYCQQLYADNHLLNSITVHCIVQRCILQGALDGCDAAITTLGGSGQHSAEGHRVDYEGNRNVLESAGILGVTRVILVTSVGCGDSHGAISDQVQQQVLYVYVCE